jgi:hypothetical protein
MSSRLRILPLLLAAWLLAGCGVKTAYNNADWLVMRWVNDRVSLTADQQELVETALERHLEWHCSSELPAYSDFLREVRTDVANDRITIDILQNYGEQASEFGQRLLARIRPTLIEFLASLDDAQVAELMESFQERNEELAEEAQRSREALQRDRVQNMEKGMRRFAGRTTRDQRERLQAWAAELEPTAALALEQRLDWQDRFAQALAIRDDRPAFEAAMSELLRPGSSYSEVLETRRDINRERTLETFVDLQQLSPDRQVKRLQKRLDGLAADLEQLSCG